MTTMTEHATEPASDLDLPEELATEVESPEPITLADMLATGATYRRLDYWVRKGYLSPERGAPGSGYSREWTERDLRMVRHLVAFTYAGFDLEAALSLTRLTLDDDADAITLDTPSGPLTLGWRLHDEMAVAQPLEDEGSTRDD